MKGEKLGHCRILDRLGAGGMGEVYLAEDTNLKRRIALKVLPPQFAASSERLKRFQFEAEVIAALNHPNIVTVYSVEEASDPSGQPVRFLTMELVEGSRLDEATPTGGFPLEEFFDLALQLVAGVAAAHARGVIHRDLKPGNIMIAEDGRLKVLDFGLAKLRDPLEPSDGDSDLPTGLVTELGRVLGTPAYMAPEQAEGAVVDARADVFALGAVLYEMATGSRPFLGESAASVQAAILTSDPRPPRELRSELPAPLGELVLRCLRKDPDERFESAQELEAELGQLAELYGEESEALKGRFRRQFLLPAAALVLVLAVVSGWLFSQGRRADRVRIETIPEIERLLEAQKTFEGFQLAKQAQAVLPNDPLLTDLIARSSVRRDISTAPDGAKVFYQDYRAPGSDWLSLGATPLTDVLLPNAYLRWRLAKSGYETLEVGAESDSHGGQVFGLTAEGAAPDGMLWVPPGSYYFGVVEPVEVPGFFLDRFEVTNREFQEFVDAGGYGDARFWKQPFELEGREITQQEALARLVDSTGRAGPATWSLGRHPEGEEDHPVRGVSWYEAAAYAEFLGKSLPTLYHWRRGSPWSHRGEVLLMSNLEGKTPAPVGEFKGIGRYGHSDLAGNVTEWCLNRAPGNQRYILGGSWLEPSYTFTNNYARPPFDRQPDMGFRLATFDDSVPVELTQEIGNFRHDFRLDEPVSDETFEFYRSLYAYDPQPLDSAVESVDDSNPNWQRETVSFTASYGDERVLAHLFLPRAGEPPYQAVVYSPGSFARRAASIEDMGSDPALFLPRSGRALIWPAYKTTLERGGGGGTPLDYGPRALRDRVVQKVNDLQRTVDYLQTRDDIESDNLGYLGLSAGSEYGPLYTSIETRFRSLVFWAGGFDDAHMLAEPAEVNPWNYASRVTTPALMINGRSDYGLPIETAQKPMFDLLAAAPEDKRHVLLDGGHLPYDWNEVYRETLAWLDRYLGPIER